MLLRLHLWVDMGWMACDGARVSRGRWRFLSATTLATAGSSSVALKTIYASMLGKTMMLRTQYGAAIERLLEQMVASAKRLCADVATEVDEDGNTIEGVMCMLDLPPRVVREPVLDENGNRAGEDKVVLEDLVPGDGGDLDVEWGEFFSATAFDRLSVVHAVMQTTGKPVLSQRGCCRWSRSAEFWRNARNCHHSANRKPHFAMVAVPTKGI